MPKPIGAICGRSAKFVLAASALCLAAGAATALAADADFCRQYAETAVRQFVQAAETGCPPVTYPVWSGDLDHHYKWCLTVPAGLAVAGTDERRKRLFFCSAAATKPVGGTIVIPLAGPDDDGN